MQVVNSRLRRGPLLLSAAAIVLSAAAFTSVPFTDAAAQYAGARVGPAPNPTASAPAVIPPARPPMPTPRQPPPVMAAPSPPPVTVAPSGAPSPVPPPATAAQTAPLPGGAIPDNTVVNLIRSLV